MKVKAISKFNFPRYKILFTIGMGIERLFEGIFVK